MESINQVLMSQNFIASIAGISPSTLSRYISKNALSDTQANEISNKNKKFNYEQARSLLKDLVAKKYFINDKIQVFFNFKGGTGKTSLCFQVSTHLALLGFKVLAIDCDPQAHLTYALGFSESDEYLTLYDAIVNNVPIKQLIRKDVYQGLDVIPSNLSLTRLELPLSQRSNREKVMDKLLDSIKGEYDFILIDTNPTISVVNQNATLAADVLNIVCETQPFSLKGLEMLIEEIQSFAEAMEIKVNYAIIPNKYESKTATSQESLGTLRHDYKNHVMEAIVRKCEDFNVSAKKQLPLFCFSSKKSIALEDIFDLVNEILKRSANKIG